MYLQNDLKGYIRSLSEEWVKIRRDLHKIPELSNREFKTQRYIMDYLDKIGIENRPVADTGVYAILRTGLPGPNIAFRADMDALPLSEEAKLPYASGHTGCMHACGHDAHMTFVLGLARVLILSIPAAISWWKPFVCTSPSAASRPGRQASKCCGRSVFLSLKPA